MAKTSSKLTAKKLKGLKEGQSAYGSNLKATKNKGGITFNASFSIGGKRYLKRLGFEKDITLTDAIDAAETYRVEQRRLHKLVVEGEAESDITVGEAYSLYIEHLRENGGKNIRAKEIHFRVHILNEFSTTPIAKVKSYPIDVFTKKKVRDGLSPSTVNRIIATFDDFFGYCQLREWIKSKPYTFTKYKEDFKKKTKISSENKKSMLEASKGPDQHPLIHLFLVFGFDVGMRHNEILNVRWENINWDTGDILLPKTKTGERLQPTTERIMKELRSLQKTTGATNGFVFSSEKSDTGRIYSMRKQFTKVCDSAGISQNYTPHFMRHTCVSELSGNGLTDRQIMYFTGHKTAAMVARYAHIDGHDAEAIERVRKTRGNDC